MTNEQIRQNAEEWVKPLIGEECGGYNENDVSLSLMKNAFIAGAHSLDEEIKELKRKNVEYFQSMEYWQKRARRLYIRRTKQGEQMKELRNELDKLRNPWISVEERLPEENQDDKGYSVKIIGLFSDGTVSKCFCSIDEGIWFIEGITCDKPTYWMPMPKLKKVE